MLGPGSTTSREPEAARMRHCWAAKLETAGWTRAADWPVTTAQAPAAASISIRCPSPSIRPAVGLIR
jgi:hypothetical protein